MSITPEFRSLLSSLTSFEPLDLQLATMLGRRSDGTDVSSLALALATVLLSRALRDGHSGISAAQLARQSLDVRPRGVSEALDAMPVERTDWWMQVLIASPLVSDGSSITPLVLRDQLLQFVRYHAAESRIAARLNALRSLATVSGVPGFSIVTGGPGTGKTTHVAKLLLALNREAPALRIALGAPTGKAAARLTESIRHALQAVDPNGAQPDLFARPVIDLEARTLHRLLGYSSTRDIFRANAGNPLPYDLVIVDEASMIDVLMLDSLLAALPPGARLMLVGDHHQLASVDAGDILGVLCAVAADPSSGSPLASSVTALTHSWRFAARPGIGSLASAVLAGDADEALAVLGDASSPDVALVRDASGPAVAVDAVNAHLEQCIGATSPHELLDALDRFRIFAPEREGRLGVSGINTAVERWLSKRGVAVNDPWYHGRPVMVTANDYGTRVFNGDVGVVWRTDAQTVVCFRGVDGAVREIAPGRLPMVETAWALTVHKSQGSEFDDIVLMLPAGESRIMSRELLYTAVTRARQRVTLVGSDAAVRAAVVQRTVRTSGLADRLREQAREA